MPQPVAILLSFLLIFAYAEGKCSTPHPTFGTGSGDKTTQTTCFSANQCDVASTRDRYAYTAGSSDVFNLRFNIVYFGALEGAAQQVFNQQTAFLKSRYLDLLGVNATWTTTVITEGPYLTVSSEDNAVHKQMAMQYYKQGHMTVMFANFDPNPQNTLGYASQFPHELPSNISEWYTIMTTSSINATGTAILHEVGHMLGLYHTFIQECNECAESMTSPDRNVVGDLISDTLPVHNQFGSCSSLQNTTDCAGNELPPPELLPLKNYMAYTDDACQTGFTPQQAARVRCYVNNSLNFLLETGPSGPMGPPVAIPSSSPSVAPSATPRSTPSATPRVISSASQLSAVGWLVAAVLVLL